MTSGPRGHCIQTRRWKLDGYSCGSRSAFQGRRQGACCRDLPYLQRSRRRSWQGKPLALPFSSLAPAVDRNCSRIREIAPHQTRATKAQSISPGVHFSSVPVVSVSLKRSHVHFPCPSLSYSPETYLHDALRQSLAHSPSLFTTNTTWPNACPLSLFANRITLALAHTVTPKHTKLSRLRPSSSLSHTSEISSVAALHHIPTPGIHSLPTSQQTRYPQQQTQLPKCASSLPSSSPSSPPSSPRTPRSTTPLSTSRPLSTASTLSLCPAPAPPAQLLT
jgi:hypothetical protein